MAGIRKTLYEDGKDVALGTPDHTGGGGSGSTGKYTPSSDTEKSGDDDGFKFADYVKNVYGGTVDLSKVENGWSPTAYHGSSWDRNANSASMDMALDAIKNQKPFQYDVTGDALYNQYKNMYLTQGKMAMQDAMAQASAMTGGYGNSYAAQVGNQAYQASVQQLNNVIPELYQMAYNKYQDERADLYNQYALESDIYNSKYNEWMQGESNNFRDWQANTANDYQNAVLTMDAQKANNSNALSQAELKLNYDKLNADENRYAYEAALNKAKYDYEQKQTQKTNAEKAFYTTVRNGSKFTNEQLMQKAYEFALANPEAKLDGDEVTKYLSDEGISGDAATYFKQLLNNRGLTVGGGSGISM